MAITSKRKFGGFWFEFTTGLHDGGGVVVNPNNAELNNPAYIDQFKNAVEAYPIIDAYFFVYEMRHSPPGELKDYPYGMLVDVLEKHSFAFESDLITFAERADVGYYVASVRDEKLRRDMQISSQVSNKPTQTRSNKFGFVYLVQSTTGAYKIGRTIDPANRLKTFSVKLPFEVEFVATIQTPDMYQLEADLHRKYDSKRVNGEWFALSPADVEYIKGLAR